MPDLRQTATPDQLLEIKNIQERWITTEQTAQYPDETIRATVYDMLTLCGQPKAPVFIVDTPLEARDLASLLRNIDGDEPKTQHKGLLSPETYQLTQRLVDAGVDLTHLTTRIQRYLQRQPAPKTKDLTLEAPVQLTHYCGIWWNVWMGWLESGKVVGITYDEEKYDLMMRFNRHCPIWLWCTRAIYILRRPKNPIHFDDEERLHNESGPALTFGTDYHLWHIHGYRVDEQIVMHPETQTVAQIDADTDNDRRTIRIERFGWARYLAESGAAQLDARKNEVENTYEILYRTTRDGHRFVATCPTGRVIYRGVPTTVDSCEAAQSWLAGPNPFVSLGRT